jgi:hypothetical protein
MAGYVDSPIPGVATYGMATNAAKLAYNNALAKIGNQRSTLLRQYGYNGQFDNQGHMTGLSVDSGNPAGLYQQQRYSHAQQLEGAKNDALNRGLSGGLARQNQHDLRYGFGVDNAQLGTGLTSGINDLTTQQGEAFNTYNQSLYEAEYRALQDAINQQLYNTAAYDDGPGPSEDPSDPGAMNIQSPADMYASPSNTDRTTSGTKKKQKAVAKQMANAYLTNKNKRG